MSRNERSSASKQVAEGITEKVAKKTGKKVEQKTGKKTGKRAGKKTEKKVGYDCSKCPGYCCTYPRIEVLDKDLERLARHFDLDLETAEKRFTRFYRDGDTLERILRHQKDTIYGSICRFFDTEARRCTIYAARPSVCREYPDGRTCGYYSFLKFERRHQEDESFIPAA